MVEQVPKNEVLLFETSTAEIITVVSVLKHTWSPNKKFAESEQALTINQGCFIRKIGIYLEVPMYKTLENI